VYERADGVHRVEELREIYHRVYREPPYHEDATAADRFAEQMAGHAALPGFSVTAVREGGVLGGFAYGVRYDDGWWPPRATAPAPPALVWPLFYVYELVVLPELRGRGHGRGLLDALLADRTEPFAVLAASTGAPAHELYRRWGWAKVGALTAPPDGVELLARPLDPNSPVDRARRPSPGSPQA
jgi:GNAT superfamily N-acetyltransferase